MAVKHPYVVIFKGPDGKDVLEHYALPEQVNARLNELWGPPGRGGGPSRHFEARGVLANRIRGLGE